MHSKVYHNCTLSFSVEHKPHTTCFHYTCCLLKLYCTWNQLSTFLFPYLFYKFSLITLQNCDFVVSTVVLVGNADITYQHVSKPVPFSSCSWSIMGSWSVFLLAMFTVFCKHLLIFFVLYNLHAFCFFINKWCVIVVKKSGVCGTVSMAEHWYVEVVWIRVEHCCQRNCCLRPS